MPSVRANWRRDAITPSGSGACVNTIETRDVVEKPCTRPASVSRLAIVRNWGMAPMSGELTRAVITNRLRQTCAMRCREAHRLRKTGGKERVAADEGRRE